MASILIIEDNINHYRFFFSLLNAKYTVFPADERDFKILRSLLSKMYSDGNSIGVKKKAVDSITEIIGDALPDLYIMDYQLLEGEDACNGLGFARDFIRKSRILFVTGIDSNKIINKINAYTRDPKNDNIMDSVLKEEKLDDEFADNIRTMVEELLKKNASDDRPLNISNL
ncbi:MAG: hypothetical protein JWR38_2857 [Mucilaginibacter sp.]|nr:hypothetical protein [Mucilaginibacter sp.]